MEMKILLSLMCVGVTLAMTEIGTYCSNFHMCFKGNHNGIVLTVDLMQFLSEEQEIIKDCNSQDFDNCMVHNWIFHDGDHKGLLYTAYLSNHHLSNQYVSSYFEIDPAQDIIKVYYDVKPTPECDENDFKFVKYFGPICNYKDNNITDLPKVILLDYSSNDLEVKTHNLSNNKLNLTSFNDTVIIDMKNNVKFEIFINHHNESVYPNFSKYDEKQLTRANLLASIVYTFGNVTYESEERKHYSLENISTYNFLSKDPQKSTSCFYENGYNLLYVCQINSSLCEKIIRSWINIINEEGWTPNCDLIQKGQNQDKIIVKDELSRCDPPTYLFSINFLLDNPSNLNTSFIEEIWPLLQLRFKYCKNAHTSEYIPDVYKWQNKDSIPSSFEGSFYDNNRINRGKGEVYDLFESHIDISLWMLEYARTLLKIQEFLRSNNLRSMVLRGSNYKYDIEKISTGLKKYNFDPNLKIYSDYLGYQPIKEEFDNCFYASHTDGDNKTKTESLGDLSGIENSKNKVINITSSEKERRQDCLDSVTYKNIFSQRIGVVNFYPIMFKIAEPDEVDSLLNIYCSKQNKTNVCEINSLTFNIEEAYLLLKSTEFYLTRLSEPTLSIFNKFIYLLKRKFEIYSESLKIYSPYISFAKLINQIKIKQ